MTRRVHLFAFVVATLSPALSFSADPPGAATQPAWDVLAKAIHSGNADHRRQALAALATIGASNERAVKMAEDALQDKDSLVRATAAAALGEMKARQAAPYLKQALEDDGEVAFAAAKALEGMGDPGGRDMLIAVIAGERSDSPGFVTNAVRDAKKKLRHPEGLMLMGAQDATSALFGPPSLGIVAAKDAFQLKGTSNRAMAVKYLANDPDAYAVTLLEWALADDNWGVRAEAAKELGGRGNQQSIPKLQYLLTDAHDAVRTMAAASIVRISEGSRSDSAATADRTDPLLKPKK